MSDMADASGDASSAARTRSRVTYFLFLGMGLATLLPWNLFISASEFYRYQFAGSPHQLTFQNSFSVAFMVTNLLSNLYAMATVTKVDPNTRILYGLAANTLAFFVGAVMPLMQDYRGSASFYVVLAQLAVTAAASGMLNNSLFALVVHFSPSHSEGILSGQAVAGIIATVAQLATAYSVTPPSSVGAAAARALGDPEKPLGGLIPRTIAYFTLAFAVNVALTAAFCYVRNDAYYQQRSKLAYTPSAPASIAEAETENLILPNPASSLTSDVAAFKSAFGQISGYTYAILLVFALTLSVYPSVTAMVTSTSGFKLLTEWHFFVYNAGDLLGRRFAPSIPVTRASSLFALALARLLFIPALFACHVAYSVWYNWIRSDFVFLALVCLLGVSNGFISTRAAMAAPRLCDQPTIAGTIVAISISIGLALGSVLSWPVRAAGCLCLPF
ncbi:hypothetical protein GGI02_004872 [Coemansia sp. RSA 2322]|uniref:Nucleoside transporter n=1 Tax=Coemansia thaxteri TaxID=2663907 RepID=A0A9W8BJT2_9FUNG|nr:hypothetical protein H4R26_002925 [Coemansia thaxteri]KAJ2464848.1 hypothetical protein GGI02_004872 [Coemansia sp. RSA 2322]KAJ2482941.1 hypothetical protein EV174_003083 [Coemansia sp. RSA 2320]